MWNSNCQLLIEFHLQQRSTLLQIIEVTLIIGDDPTLQINKSGHIMKLNEIRIKDIYNYSSNKKT